MSTESENPSPANNEKQAVSLPGDIADLLVSRVVDGVATDRDWNAFESVAGNDTTAWRELAVSLGSAQRDQAALSRAVELQIAAASATALPSEESAQYPIEISTAAKTWNFARSGLGWVAAAVLAVAAYTGKFNPSRVSTPSGISHAGIGIPYPESFPNASSTRDLLNQYLDRGIETGEVLGELPDKLMLQAQPIKLDDGSDGYEVVFVRQIVERAKMPDIYQIQKGSSDELGRENIKQVPLRIQKPRKGST